VVDEKKVEEDAAAIGWILKGGFMAIDPVCRMEVAPATAAASHEYRGTTYYF
jgi:hypothetical protein